MRIRILCLAGLMAILGLSGKPAPAEGYQLCNPSAIGDVSRSHQLMRGPNGRDWRFAGAGSRMFGNPPQDLFEVYDVPDRRSEEVVRTFCGSWLDITTRVETTGRLQFVEIVERHTPNPLLVRPGRELGDGTVPYVVVRFRIRPGDGDAGLVRLKRPGPMGVVEHETVFRYRVRPSIRLYEPRELAVQFPSGAGGGVHLLTLRGEGLERVQGVKADPPANLPVEAVRIRQRQPGQLQLQLRMGRPGELSVEEFFHRFLDIPDQTRVLVMGVRDLHSPGTTGDARSSSPLVIAYDPAVGPRPHRSGGSGQIGRMLVEGAAPGPGDVSEGGVRFSAGQRGIAGIGGAGGAAGQTGGGSTEPQPNLLPQRMPPLGQLVRVLGTGRNNTREVSMHFCASVPQDRVAVVDVPSLVWGASVVHASVDRPVRVELRSGASVLASFETTPPLRANADAQTRNDYPNRPTRIRVANVVADLLDDYGRRGCFFDRALSANDPLGRVDAADLSLVVDPDNRIDEGTSGERDNVLIIR